MRKYLLGLLVVFVMLLVLSFFFTTGTDMPPPAGDDLALFIHTDLSVKVKSRKEIIATVTLRNDTTVAYWLFPSVLPSDHPAMPVFFVEDVVGFDRVPYNGEESGDFALWSNEDPWPAPTGSEEWIVLQPGESRSWSCNLAGQYAFDSWLNRGIDSFRVAYFAHNPYWPNGHPAEFYVHRWGGTMPIYHLLGETDIRLPDSALRWRSIKVPRW